MALSLDYSIQNWTHLALDLARCTTEQIVQGNIQQQQQENPTKLLQQDEDTELLELKDQFLTQLHSAQYCI